MNDIVARLRVLLSKSCIAPAMGVWSLDLREAADEIERLRNQLTERIHMCDMHSERILELISEVKDLTERLAHMSNIALGARADVHKARSDLNKAIKERDEARREACGHDETIGGAMLEAARRGWDCFKEER